MIQRKKQSQKPSLKYNSQQERLMAIIEAYRQTHGGCPGGWTAEEVARWAEESDLYPVPKRGDSWTACASWELKLNSAVAEE